VFGGPRARNLECHFAIESGLLGEVHGGEAAGPEASQYLIFSNILADMRLSILNVTAQNVAPRLRFGALCVAVVLAFAAFTHSRGLCVSGL
jgi:hypothetical protein